MIKNVKIMKMKFIIQIGMPLLKPLVFQQMMAQRGQVLLMAHLMLVVVTHKENIC